MFRLLLSPRRVVAACIVLLLALVAYPASAQERTLVVAPDGPYTSIQAALDDAVAGDTIEVRGGIYPAPLEIHKSVILTGVDNPVIDAGEAGSIVLITAPGVVFRGFTVRNSGTVMHHEDSGIVIQADYVLVEDNILESVLFGIYFADADHGTARNNIIRGWPLELAMRGDGIRVWFSTDVTLEGNEIAATRDTLIWYANGIRIINNNFHDNRYGLHFMYSSDAVIEGNIFSDNHVGTYLMYSQGLVMNNNMLTGNNGPSGYGLALKDMDEVEARGNVFMSNRAGVYIDNSPSRYEGVNIFEDNFFAYNDVGITTQPAVARNLFRSNTFLDNMQQASTRGRGDLTGNFWSQDGQGNYWSDYAGYDADGDGIGDMAYRSEKLFESLSDQTPVLRLFTYSPATQAIEFAAAAFPSLRPEPKLIDDAPVMTYAIPPLLQQDVGEGSATFALLVLVMLGSGGAVVAYGLGLKLPRLFPQGEQLREKGRVRS